jgi:hypothetical protein
LSFTHKKLERIYSVPLSSTHFNNMPLTLSISIIYYRLLLNLYDLPSPSIALLVCIGEKTSVPLVKIGSTETMSCKVPRVIITVYLCNMIINNYEHVF